MPTLPSPREPCVDPDRRGLLVMTLTVPLAFAGSLFTATPVPVPAPALPASAATQRPRGYHTSDHIDTYYSTLRY